jgi:hypothetical protein
MQIVIKNNIGEYFYKIPEIGFTKNKMNSHIFKCINEEHAKIILEKTKEFVSYNELYFEMFQDEDKDEKKKTEKS